MRQRQCDGHRHLQRADRDVDRPVHTTDQLTVVADDDLHREHALLVDGQLLLQVQCPLAQCEQDVLLDELAPGVVGRDLRGELVDHDGIEFLGERDLIGEGEGQLAHLLLILTEGDVVALELVPALLERVDDGVDLGLGALVAHEVALERRADPGNLADRPREPAGLGVEPGRVELLHFDSQIRQRLGDLAAVLGAVGDLLQRCLQHPAASGRPLLEVAAHRVHGVAGGVAGVLVRRVDRQQLLDLGLGLRPQLVGGLGLRQRQGSLRRRDVEAEVQGAGTRGAGLDGCVAHGVVPFLRS